MILTGLLGLGNLNLALLLFVRHKCMQPKIRNLEEYKSKLILKFSISMIRCGIKLLLNKHIFHNEHILK